MHQTLVTESSNCNQAKAELFPGVAQLEHER